MKIVKLFLMAIFVFTANFAFADYKQALELYQNGKYQQSVEMVAAELDIHQDMVAGSPNYKLRYLAAHNHWKLGNTKSTEIHLQKCAAIDKQKADPLNDLALLYFEKGQIKRAEKTARQALKREKTAISYIIIGRCALNYRNYYPAKSLFEKAIALDPLSEVAYNGLGIALYKLKQYENAEIAFSSAFALNNAVPEICNNLAACYQKNGNSEKAKEYFNQALLLDGTNPKIKANYDKIN